MVIPGMQADFVPILRGRADDLRAFFADNRTGPGCAAEQNIPSVEFTGPASQHLGQESRLKEAPEMPAHVIGTDGKKERRPDAVIGEDPAEAGNAQARSAEGIHVNSQADFH
jgi:hypothetical protein